MNIKENKKALYASIRKYRHTVKLLEDHAGRPVEVKDCDRYVSGNRIPWGPEDCPLCDAYYGECCMGCCIYEDVGIGGCDRTPYPNYEEALRTAKTVTKRLIFAARKELEYLEGLYKKLKG